MRRALVITIVTLAAALLVIMLACGSDQILIATIEAGAGHIKCEIGDAGDGGKIDPTAFCSTTTTTCDSKDGFYETINSPDCGAIGPECGCDGISYYTRCVRQEARISLAGAGQCPLGSPLGTRGQSPGQVPAILCQDPRCTPKHPGCALISPLSVAQLGLSDDFLAMVCRAAGMSPLNANDAGMAGPGAACWALPDPCPSSGSPVVHRLCESSCVDQCTAIKMGKGDLYFPCEPDGAAD
jgi:hypothetical protein